MVMANDLKYRDGVENIDTDGYIVFPSNVSKKGKVLEEFILSMEDAISDFLENSGFSVNFVHIHHDSYEDTFELHMNFETDIYEWYTDSVIDSGNTLDDPDIDMLMKKIESMLQEKFSVEELHVTSTYNLYYSENASAYAS